jgi:hypothetical protein
MLFNQLLDLVYHSSSILTDELCDSLIKILGENTECSLQTGEITDVIEKILINNLNNYFYTKTSLIEFKFLKNSGLNIGDFIIINKDYENKFDVCHKLNIYKYLIVIYFLDDNSMIHFFSKMHEINPKKGDVVIFPIAWFFVYKILKKNPDLNNIYLFNNVLKEF